MDLPLFLLPWSLMILQTDHRKLTPLLKDLWMTLLMVLSKTQSDAVVSGASDDAVDGASEDALDNAVSQSSLSFSPVDNCDS